MKSGVKTKIGRAGVFVLAAVVLLSCFPVSSFAEVVTVKEPEERLRYVGTFNDSLNRIKRDRPAFTYEKFSGLSDENDAISIGEKTTDSFSEEQKSYLMIVIDWIFNPNQTLLGNLFGVIVGNQSPETVKRIEKGTDVKNLLPLVGNDCVSLLSADDDFTLRAENVTNRLNPSRNKSVIRCDFKNYDLETVKGSPLEKLFDVPTGEMLPSFSRQLPEEQRGVFEDLKLEDFSCSNAFAQAEYDGDGELTKYTRNISYTFSLSFHDMIRVITALTNIDFFEIALGIANIVLAAVDKPLVSAEQALEEASVYIQYDERLSLSAFDWLPRYFGDVDNNNEVNSYDARTILRYSVGLESIKDQTSLIYADMDFDGTVSASDARMALRTAVGLDEKFMTVPDGKSVKVIVLKTVPEEQTAGKKQAGAVYT